jgi:hypothetical protein
MNIEWIKCKNGHCDNRSRVEFNNQFKPVLFCSQTCLESYLLQNETLNPNFDYEDPKEVRELVQNLLSQTKFIQNEMKGLRRIRKTYFTLFNEDMLKGEVYKRKWSFDDKRK